MYHVDYPPDDESCAEFNEIYIDNDVFCARFVNDKVLKPFQVCGGCCEKIDVRVWGTPNDDSRKILDSFGAKYFENGPSTYILHKDYVNSSKA